MNTYQTAATDYTLEYPHYSGKDYRRVNDETFHKIASRTYEDIRQKHREDYQRLFKRVRLNLGKSQKSDLPTDLRLKKFYVEGNELGLDSIILYYCRYLMLSSLILFRCN